MEHREWSHSIVLDDLGLMVIMVRMMPALGLAGVFSGGLPDGAGKRPAGPATGATPDQIPVSHLSLDLDRGLGCYPLLGLLKTSHPQVVG